METETIEGSKRLSASWWVITPADAIIECKTRKEAVKCIEANGLKKLIQGFERVPQTTTVTKISL
jgi:hypothetical protein